MIIVVMGYYRAGMDLLQSERCPTKGNTIRIDTQCGNVFLPYTEKGQPPM